MAHDNPPDQRLHASVILGFADQRARDTFFHGTQVRHLSPTLARVTAAVHAYDVAAALTFVRDGEVLPHYEG